VAAGLACPVGRSGGSQISAFAHGVKTSLALRRICCFWNRMGLQAYETYKYSRICLQIGALGPTLIQKGMLLLLRCRSDGQFS
jgi:hypothetical protein